MNRELGPKGEHLEEALVESIRREESHAVVVLNQRLKRKLGGYLRRKIGPRLGSRVDVDDILQETYSELVRYIRRGHAVRHLDGLCRRIAINLIARQAGRKSVFFERLPARSSSGGAVEIPDPHAAKSPQNDLWTRERTDVIEGALQSLTPRQARIIRLRFYNGRGDQRMTFREIGAILGMRPEAAEKAYQRAKKKIQEYLLRRMSLSTIAR